MRAAGLPYNPPTKYARVDPERAKRIATAYDEMKHEPHHRLVRASYQALGRETQAQYEHLKKAGLKAEFWHPETEPDPYAASPRLATEDIRKNHHMFVFPTMAGYGDGDIPEREMRENPMLADTGERWGGHKVLLNDLFRAVHDYFGHAKEGVGFRADGEENAWRQHMAMYSPLARIAATAETRGQNSWLNYGPHGDKNRTARAEDTVYADQKLGAIAPWVLHEGAEDFVRPEDRAEIDRLYAEHKSVGGAVGYPLAPTSEWHGDANYEQTGGKLEYMHPDEYLSQVRPLQMDEVSKDNIEHLKSHIAAGKGLDPLAIYPSGKEDGRHRAHAAKALGIERVPVLTWSRQERAYGGPAAAPSEPPSAYFEVAPGKTWNAKQQQEWERLPRESKAAISHQIVHEFLPQWQKATGFKGKIVKGLGGFEGNSNPNYAFRPDNPEHLMPAMNSLGEVLRQDSMMGASPYPFPGSFRSGVVRVHLPPGVSPEEAHEVYKHLSGHGLAYGHSTDLDAGTMDILSGEGGEDTENAARNIDSALGGRYDVASYPAHVAFPEHLKDYGLPGTSSGALPGASVPRLEDHLRARAAARLEDLLAGAGAEGFRRQRGEGRREVLSRADGGAVSRDPSAMYAGGGSIWDNDDPLAQEWIPDKAPAHALRDETPLKPEEWGPAPAPYKAPRKQTVKNATGMLFPGIYDNPRDLAAEGAARVAPESAALKRLFGTTRNEMYERGAHRKGNMDLQLPFRGGDRSSPAIEGVMTPRNTQRLLDIVHEAMQHEGLRKGMMSWYHMDPIMTALRRLMPDDEATERYRHLNMRMGMMSPGSEVPTEINRGLALDYLLNQDRYGDFKKYAGLKAFQRGKDFPRDMEAVTAHPYHSTAHRAPVDKYVETGDPRMGSAKVPAYIAASGVPETGFQTNWPVPDAHFTRLLGLPDTRGGINRETKAASMKLSEYKHLAPWFRNKVADKAGIESVPAQALVWGAGSGATGVTSPIGAPKLEMLADHIMKVARRHGIEPEEARDRVLQGTIFSTGGAVEMAQGLRA